MQHWDVERVFEKQRRRGVAQSGQICHSPFGYRATKVPRRYSRSLQDARAGHDKHALASVTGDGDEAYSACAFSRCAAQLFLPQHVALVLSRTEIRSLPSATFMKNSIAQMIGVEPLQLGSVSCQAMFSQPTSAKEDSFRC